MECVSLAPLWSSPICPVAQSLIRVIALARIFHDHTIFPYNQGWLIIHPEAYPKKTDTNGLQNDLRVSRAAPRIQINGQLAGFDEALLFCFEGKGGSSGAKWDDVRIQLQEFIQAAVGSGQTAVCWGIGAIGSKVRFWRYQKKDANLDLLPGKGEYMVPIFIDNNLIVDNNKNAGRSLENSYDISEHWASIVRILQMMATREPTTLGYGQLA